MFRRLLLVAATTPLLACSASLRRGVNTTEAATGLEQVTRSADNEFDPAVSPDASAIAYEVATSADATPHVEVMALTGAGHGKPRVEYSSKDESGMEPAWLPGAASLVFVSSGSGTQKLVQTIGDGVARTAFVADAGDPYLRAAWPAVSPDGKTIALSLGSVELFHTGWREVKRLDTALSLSDLEGSGVTILGEGTDPAWSPDGKHLVFARTSAGHLHLFVANADGRGAQQITEGPDDDEQPSWSPDGTSIAFCSVDRTPHGSVQANLFVVRSDGSGMIQLTEGDGAACRPSWGRDGFIYFHARATDRFHIWRLHPTSTTGTTE